MLETDGNFYIGRIVESATGDKTEENLLYDPDDLTTHAVVVGMTGSGKTGLCIDLLEEAALNNIPALMIDPKGDITNTLLHFPDLLPADFEPWINRDEARREGKEIAQVAAETAELWRNGLAGWEIFRERIQALKDGPQFAVYTPGSDAGLPVNILASLEAPTIEWASNTESLRERIGGTVTALLGLIGLSDIDPVRSREHILLSNIFESAWSQEQDLDLGELIMQVQSPPFEKLGVFPVDRFFPENDRFDLAMLLNNILAAPAFQPWLQGEPLDIGRLLYTPDGRPRHSVFFIAHLSDSERMFFVTLLYSAVETWMRSQVGTGSLRALIYFDEIFGYLPPIGNPPSKTPMLRLLKQARAFGVGLVLATQNPVDIDYKALSNAGTWFIGKLGTDQDKQRLLDGLSSAAGAGLNRSEYDRLISALGKRIFLLRNVHEKHPVLFQTRWAMNYLAGPVTRAQIPALNEMAKAGAIPATSPVRAPAAPPVAGSTSMPAAAEPALSDLLAQEGSRTRPAIPSDLMEFFLPNNLTPSEAGIRGQRDTHGKQPLGILYRPVLLAQADVRYSQRKYNLNLDLRVAALVQEPDERGVVRWDDHLIQPIAERDLDRQPLREAVFAQLGGAVSDARLLKGLESDFVDWIYRTAQIEVRAHEYLKVYAGPDIDEDDFRQMCIDAAEPLEEAETSKVEAQFRRKLDSLQKKLRREERELEADQEEYNRRKREEAVKHAETLFSLFSSRRRSLSSSMSKRSMTEKAKAEVEETEDNIVDLNREIAELEEQALEAINAVDEKYDELIDDVTMITVTPYKKDVAVTHFGIAWYPYHVLEDDGRTLTVPGFEEKPAD